jgi:NADH:ubiquinone oxidoreductase subunit 3 (subunit A)
MIGHCLLLITSVVLALYTIGHAVGARGIARRQKYLPYAAGISLPIIRQRYESRLLLFCLLFMVFDILAFMLVLSKGLVYPALYLLLILLGLVLVRKSVV